VNPHPVDYHRILAQIALDHPDGGADLGREVARRFMADGDTVIPVQMPGDVADIPGQAPASASVEPPEDQPDFSGGTSPSEKMGLRDTGYQNPNMPMQNQFTRAEEDRKRAPLAEPIPPPADASAPGEPQGIPVVPVQQPTGKPAAKTVSRGTIGDSMSADDKQLMRNEATANQSARDQATVAGEQGNAEAANYADVAKQSQNLLAQHQAFQQQTDQAQMRLAQQQEALIDKYANASVDPKHYWNSLDTGHKILAGVSLMLGGGGDSSPVIRSINQDVELQKDQIERTGKAVGMVGNLVEEYSRLGMNHAQAMEHAVNTAKLVGEQRASAIAGQFAGPKAQAMVGQTIATNSGNRITAQLSNRKTAAETVAQRASAWNSSEEAQGKHINNVYAQKQMDQNAASGIPLGINRAMVVEDEDGHQGIARNEKSLPEYQKVMMPVRTGLNALNQIEAERQKGTLFHQGQLSGYAGSLGMSMAQLAGEHESQRNKEIIDKLTGNPTSITPIWWDQHKEALKQILTNTSRSAEKTYQVDFNRPPPINQRSGKLGG
jgi:hypothetical protein